MRPSVSVRHSGPGFQVVLQDQVHLFTNANADADVCLVSLCAENGPGGSDYFCKGFVWMWCYSQT